MNQILINKDVSIRIDTVEWQDSPNGNKFKCIGISTVGEVIEKWIEKKKVVVNDMLYHFKYEDGKYFDVKVDYTGKFIKLIKNT